MQTSYSATSLCWQSSRKNHAAGRCLPGAGRDGCPVSMSIVETSGKSILHHGREAWIVSQRDSLARIFHALGRGKASKETGAASSGRCFEQLMLFGPGSSSSKTARESEPGDGEKSSPRLWRGDIPGETERLPLLLSVRRISGIDGGCLLPTLTVTSNWNRKGMSAKSGDGLGTALRRLQFLPTCCASDYKSPYSAEGYDRQRLKRSKPLRDTLAHITGHRLTPVFAEWWMGWPFRWTAAQKEPESRLAATGKSRLRQRRHG